MIHIHTKTSSNFKFVILFYVNYDPIKLIFLKMKIVAASRRIGMTSQCFVCLKHCVGCLYINILTIQFFEHPSSQELLLKLWLRAVK